MNTNQLHKPLFILSAIHITSAISNSAIREQLQRDRLDGLLHDRQRELC